MPPFWVVIDILRENGRYLFRVHVLRTRIQAGNSFITGTPKSAREESVHQSCGIQLTVGFAQSHKCLGLEVSRWGGDHTRLLVLTVYNNCKQTDHTQNAQD